MRRLKSRKRLFATVCVSALILLAGCSGFMNGSGEQTPSTPDSSPETPISNGSSTSGQPFSEIIDETSESAVSEGSIQFQAATIYRTENGEPLHISNRTVKADISEERVLRSAKLPVAANDTAFPHTVNTYTNGSRAFEQGIFDDRTEYDAVGEATRYPDTRPLANQTAIETQLALEGTRWEESSDNQSVYTLSSVNKTAFFRNTGDSLTIENATGRLTLSDSGIIQSYHVEITRTDATGQTGTVVERFTLLSMGDSSVVEPEWVDEARPTRSGSSTVEPTDEQAP